MPGKKMNFAAVMRRIQEKVDITLKELSANRRIGRHDSTEKGDIGYEIAGYGEYEPGDDIRNISWPVSNRTGELTVERKKERRVMPVTFIVDLSPSVFFSSGLGSSKLDCFLETFILISFSAIIQRDNVGLIMYDAKRERLTHEEPEQGHDKIFDIARRIFYARPSPASIFSSEKLAKSASRYPGERGLIIAVSDFLFPPDKLKLFLRRIKSDARDLIVVLVRDPVEFDFPDLAGQSEYQFSDVMTGERFLLNAREAAELRQRQKENLSDLKRIFRAAGASGSIFLRTDEDYLRQAGKFFFLRKRF